MTKKFSYDIQGLRALAVLSVVIYHINPNLLPGGYLGVDIFFVISGYLIIGHIWEQLENKEFKLIDFYVKRVKRLFPALFVMIVITILAGYFILLPSETTDLHKSVISSLFYFSNFYFYSITDYFNTSIHFSPLLHTWSLSVEEQFYIVFPLILMVLFKVSKKILLFLISTFLIFFALSVFLVSIDQSLAFYSSPSRFFQFLAGGIVSISNTKIIFSKKSNEFLYLFGLILILSCLFFYTKETVFPGVNALIPTFATLLIIYSSEKAKYVNLLLSNKYSQLIGNASYSIYLWHWPLIVYYKIHVGNFTKIEQFILFILSLILGILSWKFVENNTRYINYKINVLIASFIISFSLTIIMLLTLDGMKYRFTKKQLNISNYLNYKKLDYREGRCFITSKSNNTTFDQEECIQYDKTKENILLIGDSHGAMFYSTLKNNLLDNQTLSQVTASGCRPLIDSKGEERCTNLMNFAFHNLIKNNKYHTVILSGRWKGKEVHDVEMTIDYLKKYSSNIIVIGRNIDFSQNLPRLLVNLDSTFMSSSDLLNYRKIINIEKSFKTILKGNNKSINYISTFDPFCNERGCELTLNNVPIIYDTNHLTHEAIDYIFSQSLNKIINKKGN